MSVWEIEYFILVSFIVAIQYVTINRYNYSKLK